MAIATRVTLPARSARYPAGLSASELQRLDFTAVGSVYVGKVSIANSDYQTHSGDRGSTTIGLASGPFAASGLVPWSSVGKLGALGTPSETGTSYAPTAGAHPPPEVYLGGGDCSEDDAEGSSGFLVAGYTDLIGQGATYSFGGWTIANNVYNPPVGAVYGQDYSVYIHYNPYDVANGSQFIWSFPQTSGSDIFAFPEIVHGSSPWSNAGTNTNDFPRKLSSINSLTVNYDISLASLTGVNVAFDLWFTSVPGGGVTTIQNEVLIVIHEGVAGAAGTFVGPDSVISGQIYDNPSANDQTQFLAGLEPFHQWNFTEIITSTDKLSGQIDLRAIFNELEQTYVSGVATPILSESEYLSDIELGSEVYFGKGSMTLNNYGINLNNTLPAPGALSDLLWQYSATGQVVAWTMQGGSAVAGQVLATLGDPTWRLVGSGNFGDGTSDVIWQNSVTGLVLYWTMQGAGAVATHVLANLGDPSWRLVGDVNFGDGTSDVLWQNSVTGQVNYWTMQGGAAVAGHVLANLGDPSWRLVGGGNLGDGTSDIFWQNSVTGLVVYWTMQGTGVVGSHVLANLDPSWRLVGDVNFGDGTSDVVWQNTATGLVVYWTMQGTGAVASQVFANLGDPSWRLVGPLSLSGGTATTPAAAAGAAGKLVDGTLGGQQITGGPGTTTILGGIGDTISGSTGAGASTIVGAAGDTVTAGSGSDLINALAGSQAIFGGSGHATVWGGGSGDTITGGQGQLMVDIDHANYPGSVLIGDNGVKGDTTVTGFSQTAGDRLFFQNESSASITSVVASAQTSGGNTLITLPDGATMTLVGITKLDATFFA
jgi:Glycosyl hydrolase family 12